MPSLETNYEYYLNTDFSNHIGDWVALYDNKIVAFGKDVKEVALKASEVCGNKKFLLYKVPSAETIIYS
mgnify:CR=1 FL=1